MKHYFLFGESAVEIYGEDGVDALIEQNEEEYLGSTEVFVFEDGITSPADLLCAFNGYGDYSCITEEEYEKLKDCF